ncbi:MAG: glycosyltransferase [Pseudohongiellaceae bacterium]
MKTDHQHFSAAQEVIDCSVIIPTRDQVKLLESCINSILASQYSGSLEIIVVDNNSSEDETLLYLESFTEDPRIKVVRWPHPFNFSRLNNEAAQFAKGEVLCFLNNDIEVINNNWLEELVPIARRYDVGAVGTILLYPDGSIQHAGIALDSECVAKHVGVGESKDFLKHYSAASLCKVVAVTAACMFTRRELFLVFGGFNESDLPVSFNDVDYCLRLGAAGYPVFLNFDIALIHYESVTRKSDDLPQNRPRALKEKKFMDTRWATELKGKRYLAGVPDSFRFPALDSSAPESSSVLENFLHELSATEVHKSSLSFNSGTILPSNIEWERKYHQLEIQYRVLEAQARESQQLLSQIVDSKYWRYTGFLRLLLRTLTNFKQRCGRFIMRFSQGRRLLMRIGRVPRVEPEAQVVKIDVKTVYDEQARTALDAFLASDEVLEFRVSATIDVSIILVFFNKAELSYLCLKSILAHAGSNYEVVIIDNASTDESVLLCSRIKGARISRNSENAGFVHAVNQAVQLATGETLLLLNNDAVLEPDSVEAALKTLNSRDDVGAVGGMIRLLDGKLQEAGSIIWDDGSCVGYGRGNDPEQPEYMFQREVDYCSGAFLMFNRELFAKMGGFDEAFAPAYYEESDFCIRLKKQGYKVIYEPRARITHYEFASSGGFSNAAKLQAAHRLVLREKHSDYLAQKYSNLAENYNRARTANRNPNVLFIDDRVPHASLGAGYPRCLDLLRELASCKLNVTFYPLLFPEEQWDSTYSVIPQNIEVILHCGKQGLLDFLQRRAGFFDYIIVSRAPNMDFLGQLIAARTDLINRSLIVYDAEAVTATRDILRSEIQGTPLSEDKKTSLLKQELDLARYAQKIITVSPLESMIFRNAGYKNVIEIGHRVDVTPSKAAFGDRVDLLFVGALRDDTSPNVDSLLWFTQKVLPLINNKLKEPVRLIVAGDNIAPQLKIIDRTFVKFIGRIDDIAQLYNHCRVFVAPTRFAAGIPRKIHDAAAYGLPSVSTPLLARQLGWKNQKQLIVADTAEEFAAACCRLYEDEALWNQIRAAGLESVSADCSPATFSRGVSSVFEKSTEIVTKA